jgi:hypothetical protein
LPADVVVGLEVIGLFVGAVVGFLDGAGVVVGFAVGFLDGAFVGFRLGLREGARVTGCRVGTAVTGHFVGDFVVGRFVGLRVGDEVAAPPLGVYVILPTHEYTPDEALPNSVVENETLAVQEDKQ